MKGSERMTKEEYKSLYQELYPSVEQIIKISESYGVVQGISLTTGDQGYIAMNVRYGSFELIQTLNGVPRFRDNSDFESEPLFEEGENECEESEICQEDTRLN